MKKSSRRALGRSIWFSLLACVLVQTSCTREVPPEAYFSVGMVDSATFDGQSLTLHHVQLISNGLLVTKELPPEEQLKGKVLLQVLGLARATQVAGELGTALHFAGAPQNTPEAKSWRERHVTLSADQYDLMEYPVSGGPREINTVDIDLIIVD